MSVSPHRSAWTVVRRRTPTHHLSSRPRRVISRAVTLASAGLIGVFALAGQASAHVEVSADNAQAGATGVTVSFSAEAESTTAGITGLQVQLPDGIAPADVALLSGPAGWALAPTADGYTVSGPPIAPGENADYQITVAQLPTDATELAFKTLQNYDDGRQDAWVEIATDPTVEVDNPAPILTLSPAASTAPAPTTASTATSPATSTDPTPAPADADASAADSDSGSSSVLWWLAGAAALVAAVTVVVVVRRRGSNEAGSASAGE